MARIDLLPARWIDSCLALAPREVLRDVPTSRMLIEHAEVEIPDGELVFELCDYLPADPRKGTELGGGAGGEVSDIGEATAVIEWGRDPGQCMYDRSESTRPLQTR